MEAETKEEGKRANNRAPEDEDGDGDEDNANAADGKKKAAVLNLTPSKRRAAGGSSTPRSCQVEACGADMAAAKPYHRRHRVCEYHAKAVAVLIGGVHQRFCQQCSRFHELPEFDESKRSCRRRLAGHNERRRKSSFG